MGCQGHQNHGWFEESFPFSASMAKIYEYLPDFTKHSLIYKQCRFMIPEQSIVL